MMRKPDGEHVNSEVYEAPRLEVCHAFRGPRGRSSGSDRGNFICNQCNDWH